jgi:hypothetical protein
LVVSFFTLPYWVFGSYEKMANFSNARKQYREFGDSNDANRLDITKTMYAYDNWLENSNDFNDFYNTTEISSIPEMQNIKAKLKKDIMNIHFQDVPMYLSNDQKKRFISSDKRTLADEDELSRIDSLFSNLFFQGFNELVKAYLLAKKEGDLKSFYASALMPTMCYPFRSRQITEYLLGLNRSPEEIAKGLEADVEITPIVYQLTSYIKRKLKNGTIQVPFNSTRKDFFINQITKYLSNAIQGIIQDKLVKPNVTNYEPGKGYSGFFMIFNKEKNLVDIYFTREISNNENLKRYIELKLDDKQALFDALRNITTWLLEEQVDYNENESSYIPENHKINISDDEIKKIISNVKSIKGNDNYKLSDIKAALGKSLGVSKLPSDIIARAQNLDEGE